MSSKPDFVLKVGRREEKFARRVGAAWKNRAGGINIKLDPGIALVGSHDIDLTLWPNDEARDGGRG